MNLPHTKFRPSLLSTLLMAAIAVLAVAPAHAAFEYRVPVAGLKPASATCALPWGGTLLSGSSVVAYQSATVTSGQSCVSETRTCATGTLSGSYSNQQCSVAPLLAASDASTVFTSVSGTTYTLTNTSGRSQPAQVGTSGPLTGGLMTPLCTGDFTLTFTADRLISFSGFLGVTAVSATHQNFVSQGYGALVEQAYYETWGAHLLRNMAHYSYIGNGASSFQYTVSRTGTTLTGIVANTTDTTTVSASSPMAAYIYFVKDAAVRATTTQTVNITNVSYSCTP